MAALPKHIAAIEKALDGHLRKLEADKAALAANQKERKRIEGEIQMNEQKISKLRDQMLGAKTNEQYRAFQHEIEYLEKEIRKFEDRILELMSESEALDGNVKKADAALKEEKQAVEGGEGQGAGAHRGRSGRAGPDQAGARGDRQATPQDHGGGLRSHFQEARRGGGGGSAWAAAARPARSLYGRNISRICAAEIN